MSPTRGDDRGPATALPRPLVVAVPAAVALLLTLAWVLVPWTAAPPGPVDPTAGLPVEVVDASAQVAASLRLPALLSLAAGLLAAALVVLIPPGRWLLARSTPGRGGTTAAVPAAGAARGAAAGASPGTGRAAARIVRQAFGQVVVPVVVVLGVVLVVRWPFGVWAELVRRDAGLSVQGWAGWAQDRLVSAGFEAVALTGVVLTVVLLARAAPRWWPGLAAGVTATLVVVGSLLHPVLVDPALADLQPLPEGPVREQVEQTAARAGAPVADVLVSDASARTTTLNAYVSGLGPTRRLVLQDTLLSTMPPEQVLAVVAHETAHAAAQDVLRGTVLGAAAAGAVVLLLGAAGVALTARGLGRGRGVADGATNTRATALRDGRAPAGVSAAGVVLLVVLVVDVVAAPASALVSRQVERAADVRAVELTQDPAAYAEAMRTLLVTNRADPSPPAAYQWWFGTHPSGAERVARADAAREPHGGGSG